MFDFSTLFSSDLGETLSVGNIVAIVFAALVLGLVMGVVYILTHKDKGYSQSFILTLVMLLAVVSIIILLVGNSIARAFSLAGAFSLIRFRSTPGEPFDIAFVFSCVAIGLACGIGYIGYAALFTIILGLAIILLKYLKFASVKTEAMSLKVVVPEDLNVSNFIDDILNEYSKSWKEIKLKSINFGSLFELSYTLELKEGSDRKEMLDKIRQRNGNLNVSLTRFNYVEYSRFMDMQ